MVGLCPSDQRDCSRPDKAPVLLPGAMDVFHRPVWSWRPSTDTAAIRPSDDPDQQNEHCLATHPTGHQALQAQQDVFAETTVVLGRRRLQFPKANKGQSDCILYLQYYPGAHIHHHGAQYQEDIFRE